MIGKICAVLGAASTSVAGLLAVKNYLKFKSETDIQSTKSNGLFLSPLKLLPETASVVLCDYARFNRRHMIFSDANLRGFDKAPIDEKWDLEDEIKYNLHWRKQDQKQNYVSPGFTSFIILKEQDIDKEAGLIFPSVVFMDERFVKPDLQAIHDIGKPLLPQKFAYVEIETVITVIVKNRAIQPKKVKSTDMRVKNSQPYLQGQPNAKTYVRHIGFHGLVLMEFYKNNKFAPIHIAGLVQQPKRKLQETLLEDQLQFWRSMEVQTHDKDKNWVNAGFNL